MQQFPSMRDPCLLAVQLLHSQTLQKSHQSPPGPGHLCSLTPSFAQHLIPSVNFTSIAAFTDGMIPFCSITKSPYS